MCEQGNTKLVRVKHHGPYAAVDSCIAPIVEALNIRGIATIAFCCGHGRIVGDIALADGRELIISPDFDTSRKIIEIVKESL